MNYYLQYESRALEEAYTLLRAIRAAVRQPRERLFLILRFREARLWQAFLLIFGRGELRVADSGTRMDIMCIASLHYMTSESWEEQGLVQRMQRLVVPRPAVPRLLEWLKARVPTSEDGARACTIMMESAELRAEAEGGEIIRSSCRPYSEGAVESLVGISLPALVAMHRAFSYHHTSDLLSQRRPEHIVRLAEEVALRLPQDSETANVRSQIWSLFLNDKNDEAWELFVYSRRTARSTRHVSEDLKAFCTHADIQRWIEGTEAMLGFLGGRPLGGSMLDFRRRDGDLAASSRIRGFLVGETRPFLGILFSG